jgi:putative ABC transport system substrate-binding protein
MNIARREFITLVGGTAAAWPLAALAQQPGRMRRLAMLIGGPLSDPGWGRWTTAFREELAKLGWIDGGNLRIDLRFVESGGFERSLAIAAELVRLAPDVIFTSSGLATRAAQEATRTIPIVFTGPSTVGGGENVARPEGNLTGFPILYPSIAGKWVELLKDADTRVTRIAYANNNPALLRNAGGVYVGEIEEVARAMAVEVTDAEYRDDRALERGVEAFAAKPNGGLIVLPSAFTARSGSRDLIRRLAEKYRLPAIHWDSLYPAEGGLMSYGSDFEYLHRRAAGYVDRILRGAKVSELPIERPTRFQLVVNLKAAKTIGLAIPEPFLVRADEVIE